MAKIDMDEVASAYENFCRSYFDEDHFEKGWHFWNFIGMTKKPQSTYDHWLLPKKQIKIIELLTGPHYFTVCKMLEVKGHKWNNPNEIS